MSNTVTYNKHDYVMKMRTRLNKLTCWKEVLSVKFTNVRTFVTGSLTVEPGMVGGTRGTAYAYQDFTIAQDTGTLSGIYQNSILIDEADRYQQSYMTQMEVADRQGKIIDEKIQSLMLASHASWTDFGQTDLDNTGDDDTTAITVSALNIDDLVRAIKRKIHSNNGTELAVDNGIYIIWRPADFELLEAYAQANGYTEADLALKNGIPVQKGFYYMGVTHYLSTQHTATHVQAGIKKMGTIGILRGTYGRVKFIEDPGKVSGLGINARLDYGFDWCSTSSYLKEFTLDVNVA